MGDWQPVTGTADKLGESPFWHPLERRLYWLDIQARAARRLDPSSGRVQSWVLPQEPGCIAPARDGGLVLALRDGFYRATAWDGELVPLARVDHAGRSLRFNDGKADPRGRFWAGTYAEQKSEPAAALYCLDPVPPSAQTGLRRMHVGFFSSNGLAFAPDARTLYWADTQAHRVLAWDWDAPANVLTRQRVLRQFAPKPAGWRPGDPGYGGRPDGAAVDAQGGYWCAMYEGACLLRLSPAGELLARLPVPVQCPTMPCFGGDDLKTLYVTSARQGRPARELARWPLSGRVIALRVEVPGLLVNFFSG